jgi:hypothetical protein
MLECDPKLVAIDEETNDQIVHRRRFGKANRAAHETLDPGPQIPQVLWITPLPGDSDDYWKTCTLCERLCRCS